MASSQNRSSSPAGVPGAARRGGRQSHPSQATILRALGYVDAGDRCARNGDRAGALTHYGVALNEYIREGLLGMAGSVAERMIQRFPDVVRARMTLAVLSLAEGLRVLPPAMIRSNCTEFRDYVQAARKTGQEELAVRQLRWFAEATESVPVRERIAELLHLLGDEEGARAVMQATLEEREGVRAPQPHEDGQHERWVEILLTSPTGLA